MGVNHTYNMVNNNRMMTLIIANYIQCITTAVWYDVSWVNPVVSDVCAGIDTPVSTFK